MLNQKLLTLSDVKVIDPVRVNPNGDAALRLVDEYCTKFNIKHPTYEEIATMSPYLYPRTSIRRLAVIALAMNWLYFIDDAWDRNVFETTQNDELEMRRVFENSIGILLMDLVPPDDHILYPPIFELRKQFLKYGNEDWLRRMAFNTMQHLKATRYTLHDIMEQEGDMLERYINLRGYDSGMYPAINAIEFAYNILIPDEVMEHEYLRRVTLHTVKIGGLMNDLFSYEREVLVQGSDFNLISILMIYQSCSFEEAVHEAVILLNQITDDFVYDQQNMPDWKDAKINRMVRSYVRGLRDQINATWHWQLATNRYRSPNSPFPELRTML